MFIFISIKPILPPIDVLLMLALESRHIEFKKKFQVSPYIQFVLKYFNLYIISCSSRKMRTCPPPISTAAIREWSRRR